MKKEFQLLTREEMCLISGGRRCTDNSRPDSKPREKNGFERGLTEKARNGGRLGRASGLSDIAASRGQGC